MEELAATELAAEDPAAALLGPAVVVSSGEYVNIGGA